MKLAEEQKLIKERVAEEERGRTSELGEPQQDGPGHWNETQGIANPGQVNMGNEGVATKEGGTWSMHSSTPQPHTIPPNLI